MKTILSLIVIVFVAALAPALRAQEYRGINFHVTVSNEKGRVQNLVAGVREGASSGLDPMMEEAELPPLPPAEIFDARLMSTPGASQLGLGSWRDFRPIGTGTTFTYTFTIAYQAGEGASGVLIHWGLPLNGRVTKVLVDGEDKSGVAEVRSSFTSGQVILTLTFDYRPLSFRADPTSVALTGRNTDPQLPTSTFDIIPEGDAQAAWTLAGVEEWLTVTPASGEGRQTISVSLNRHTMPAGTYQTNLRFRSEVYPASLDVPVNLTMVVGTDAVPSAPTVFVTNHPNPFRDGTTLMVTLSEAAVRDPGLRMEVRDILGRVVSDLSSRLNREAGTQRLDFLGTGLTPGLYTCTVEGGAARSVRTLLLVK